MSLRSLLKTAYLKRQMLQSGCSQCRVLWCGAEDGLCKTKIATGWCRLLVQAASAGYVYCDVWSPSRYITATPCPHPHPRFWRRNIVAAGIGGPLDNKSGPYMSNAYCKTLSSPPPPQHQDTFTIVPTFSLSDWSTHSCNTRLLAWQIHFREHTHQVLLEIQYIYIKFKSNLQGRFHKNIQQ